LAHYVNKLFTIGISKFPNYASLRLSYAFFLIEHLGNKNKAI